jgi:hypothetical protein
MSSTYFPLPIAKTKLNKRVRATLPLADINIGDTGIVTSYYKMGRLYGLNIKWDHMNVVDGFSKDDYEMLLEEV